MAPTMEFHVCFGIRHQVVFLLPEVRSGISYAAVSKWSQPDQRAIKVVFFTAVKVCELNE